MKELILPAELSSLEQAMAFLEEELEAMGCPMKDILQISVCFEEMFVNVARYAYSECE